MGAVTVGAAAPSGNWSRPGQIGLDLDTLGKYRVRRVILTGSASYATGGDTLAPSAVGLDRIVGVLAEATDAQLDTARKIGDRGVSFDCSVTTACKMIVRNAANTEVAAAGDASGGTVQAWVFGY